MAALDNVTTWLPTVAAAIARAAGMAMVAPVVGDSAVPMRLRYAIAVGAAVAAVAAAGCVAAPVAMPASTPAMVLALAGEAAIGAVLGGVALLVFAGVELAAVQIANQMGLSMAEMYDSSQESGSGAPGLRRLFVLTAVVAFMAVGGHRELLAGLMQTYRDVPLMSFGAASTGAGGSTGLAGAAGGVLAPAVSVLTASFMLALRLAAPVLIAMLLATVALGILQRTAPQFQVFSTGLPVRALVGIALLAVALAAMPDVLSAGWAEAQRQIVHVVNAFGVVSSR